MIEAELRRFIGRGQNQVADQSRLHTLVVRGLRRYIHDHRQPIARAAIGSAAKRVVEQVANALEALVENEEIGA